MKTNKQKKRMRGREIKDRARVSAAVDTAHRSDATYTDTSGEIVLSGLVAQLPAVHLARDIAYHKLSGDGARASEQRSTTHSITEVRGRSAIMNSSVSGDSKTASGACSLTGGTNTMFKSEKLGVSASNFRLNKLTNDSYPIDVGLVNEDDKNNLENKYSLIDFKLSGETEAERTLPPGERPAEGHWISPLPLELDKEGNEFTQARNQVGEFTQDLPLFLCMNVNIHLISEDKVMDLICHCQCELDADVAHQVVFLFENQFKLTAPEETYFQEILPVYENEREEATWEAELDSGSEPEAQTLKKFLWTVQHATRALLENPFSLIF